MLAGGFIQHMITAMKNNARRRKTTDTSMAGKEGGSMYPTDARKIPKHTPEQVAAAKAAFKITARQETKKRWLVLAITIICSPIIGYLLFRLMNYLIH